MDERVEERIRWLALRKVRGMGWKSLSKGLAEHGSSEVLWNFLPLSDDDRKKIWHEAAAEYADLENFGIELLLCDDVAYPSNLKCLDDKPLFLYSKGQMWAGIERAVAVVGSRNISSYGKEVTRRLVGQLVAQNYTIVSGMAKGVDTVAHQMALACGGKTIAVWGSGLDTVYPAENTALAEQILDKGLVISPFGLGVEAQSYTFAVRNSVIAGLSQAIVITEAGLKSGSLLTAEWARTYRRPVFAVPGSIFGKGSWGTHSLIKLGANLAVDAADIVDKLDNELGYNNSIVNQSSHVIPVDLTASQTQIVTFLQQEPQSVDSLIRQSQLSAAEVAACLMELEIRGVVRLVGEEWVAG